MTAPIYLVGMVSGAVRHIQRESLTTRSFCGARRLTALLMGTEPELPICKKCQRAWDKQPLVEWFE